MTTLKNKVCKVVSRSFISSLFHLGLVCLLVFPTNLVFALEPDIDKNLHISVSGDGVVEVVDGKNVTTVKSNESNDFYYELGTLLSLNIQADQSIEEILINGQAQPIKEAIKVTSVDLIIHEEPITIAIKFSDHSLESLDEQEEIEEIRASIREQLGIVDEKQIGYIGDISDLTMDFPMLFATYTLKVDTAHPFEIDSDSSYWGDMHPTYLGNYLVFCTDPHVSYLSGDSYYSNGDSFSAIGVSNATRDDIALGIGICLDQYDATGNWDWYAIAQSYVWDKIGDSNVWLLSSSWNNKSAVKSRISWVKTQVTNFKVKPNFNTYTYNIKVGQELKITDTNGVLKNYSVKSSGGLSAKIEGNSLIVTGTQAQVNKTPTITLERKINNAINGTSIDFVSNTSRQRMGHFATSPLTATVKFNVKPSTGELTLTKESSNQSISENNNCYSLEGALYTLYSEKDCVHAVGTFTTRSDGSTDTLTLEAGTYYLKETKAPKGYAIDSQVYEVLIESGKKNTFKVTDIPQSAPVSILVQKIDADTNGATPSGKGSLANAEFTFKFYPGQYDDNVDPASLGISPNRIWIMKTNDEGLIHFQGDQNDFYINEDNKFVLPLGTLTIQETKSPTGYHLDKTIYVRKITSDGAKNEVNTYNAPTIKENAVKIQLFKYESGTTNGMENVVFIHTLPDGSTESLTTTSNGHLEMSGLAMGHHKITEKSAPDDYTINPNCFEFEVAMDGSITAITDDLDSMGMAFQLDSLKNGSLIIYDDVKPFSLVVHKINNASRFLEGAEFTLYQDANCNQEIATQRTGPDGNLTFSNLMYQTTYYLKETTAPTGYRLDHTIHTIKVNEISSALDIFRFDVDDVSYDKENHSNTIYLETEPGNNQIHMVIKNQTLMKLPHTGSSGYFILVSLIFLLSAIAIVTKIRSKKDRKEESINE